MVMKVWYVSHKIMNQRAALLTKYRSHNAAYLAMVHYVLVINNIYCSIVYAKALNIIHLFVYAAIPAMV
jgi:hypothetical protein